ncbi:hypothetical protein RS130_09395 [Paraglaciecola aquimarina]|uniref:Uncharacterized protein n=1 Tax=Paraglaciecola aquimarina TaxID=1235557 RepID=A0ABU3SVT3_9ALTE|nr:hypothetical protein [Paraglaciecola aquimarina]MDU0354121.1 hypothetical protein [Paraglaciecola aquimarina]
MKFVIGKFSNQVFHALTKKEVTLLFKLVPDEWTKPIRGVVLSAKVFKNTKVAQPVMYSPTTSQLSIFSRGLKREEIARQVLIELAVIGGELEAINPLNVTKEQDAVLDGLVKTYLDKFLKARV